MKPHLHCEAIKAWADGAAIQWRTLGTSVWIDCVHMPEWQIDREYRAKPEPAYPTTTMTAAETLSAARGMTVPSEMRRALANAALRHACDNGQVVRREEFDRAMATREAREMAVAIAVRDALLGAVISEVFGTSIKYETVIRSAVDSIVLSDVIASVEVQS
jgi:hypothetical protein